MAQRLSRSPKRIVLTQDPTRRLSPSPSHHCLRKLATMSTHKQKKPHEKHPKFPNLPLGTSGPMECALTGTALLNTPYFNKGSAFPADERQRFNLTGLLPQSIQTLDEQVERAYRQYSTRRDDLAKNTFMTSMKEQNDVLYFRVRLTRL